MSIGKRTVQELLCSVAARTPAPGGGAVAATVGALAAALSEMVVNYSQGKPEAGGAEELIEEARRLEAMRDSALALADADAEAFTRLSALWKLEPDDERRRSGWNDAVTGAIEVPRRVMAASRAVLDLLQRVAGRTSPNLRSDLAIAALLTRAAVDAAAWNVRINLPLLDDRERARAIEQEMSASLAAARKIAESIEQACLSSNA